MKKSKFHIGEKIKRLRAFKGLTQEDLANSIGKTRSLISFLERTGNINKYTLKEIAAALGLNIDELENLNPENIQTTSSEKGFVENTNDNAYQKLVEQLQTEIIFLKQTINQQWSLFDKLSKRK